MTYSKRERGKRKGEVGRIQILSQVPSNTTSITSRLKFPSEESSNPGFFQKRHIRPKISKAFIKETEKKFGKKRIWEGSRKQLKNNWETTEKGIWKITEGNENEFMKNTRQNNGI